VNRYRQDQKLNLKVQYYKGIPLQVIQRAYKHAKAKRFTLNGTNQNVWIPNKHLEADGTLKVGENIDYIFKRSYNQLKLSGMVWDPRDGLYYLMDKQQAR